MQNTGKWSMNPCEPSISVAKIPLNTCLFPFMKMWSISVALLCLIFVGLTMYGSIWCVVIRSIYSAVVGCDSYFNRLRLKSPVITNSLELLSMERRQFRNMVRYSLVMLFPGGL